jgi:low affinity Fe/Cu permease
MVFLIQNTQNRDSIAMQVKLDELIRASDRAHNVLLDLEELDDRTLERIRSRYRHLAEEARAELARGETDTDVREVESPGR